MGVSTLNNLDRDVWRMILENLDVVESGACSDSSVPTGHLPVAAPRPDKSVPATVEEPDYAK